MPSHIIAFMPILHKVTILLITWNAGDHLARCLFALSKQTSMQFEIIVIDNGSTDGSLASLSSWNFVEITIRQLQKNLGFAVANNIGARLASGEWIVLLNADAYPEPDWLENLLRTAEQNSQYNFFSSRQIQYNDPHLLDGAGDEYHVSGLAWRRFYNHIGKEYGLEPVSYTHLDVYKRQL